MNTSVPNTSGSFRCVGGPLNGLYHSSDSVNSNEPQFDYAVVDGNGNIKPATYVMRNLTNGDVTKAIKMYFDIRYAQKFDKHYGSSWYPFLL